MIITRTEFYRGMMHVHFPSECNRAYLLSSRIMTFLPHCKTEICHLCYLGYLNINIFKTSGLSMERFKFL